MDNRTISLTVEDGEQALAISAVLTSQRECQKLIRAIKILMPLLSNKRDAVAGDFGLPDGFDVLLRDALMTAQCRREIASAIGA